MIKLFTLMAKYTLGNLFGGTFFSWHASGRGKVTLSYQPTGYELYQIRSYERGPAGRVIGQDKSPPHNTPHPRPNPANLYSSFKASSRKDH